MEGSEVSLFGRIIDNPIIHKELKGRMRGRRGFIAIVAYLGLISFFITAVYLLLAADNGLTSGDPGFLQTAGKAIFSAVALLELLMLGFVAPALTSGAISSERERKTFDLLRASLLSARFIVLSKIGSAAAFLLLLIFTALPIQSLAFFLGGVGAAEIVILTLMLVVTALFCCALGLFFSSLSQRTLVSTVLSYASILVSFVLFAFFLLFVNILDVSISSTSQPLNDLVNAAAWAVLSINPFFAAVMSEIILIEEQNLFLTTSGFLGSTSFPLPSPWVICVVFHVALTALLLSLSVYFVARPDQ